MATTEAKRLAILALALGFGLGLGTMIALSNMMGWFNGN